MDTHITVAIMGCEVNGPVEAQHADLGITGAGNSVILFRHGKIIKTLSVTDDYDIDRLFEEELEKMTSR
jgi:(E)-4-hydroxy-3-methylbut-2-enyl-diphosphate synthase